MLNIKNDISVTGKLTAVLTNELTGEQTIYDGPNLVVTTGKNLIASRLVGTASAVMSHMAIGSGSAAPTAADTTLATQTGTRVALSGSTATNNVVTYTATFPAGNGTGTVAECGIFNAASAGTMLCRSTSISLTKGANDSLAITWTVTIN